MLDGINQQWPLQEHFGPRVMQQLLLRTGSLPARVMLVCDLGAHLL